MIKRDPKIEKILRYKNMVRNTAKTVGVGALVGGYMWLGEYAKEMYSHSGRNDSLQEQDGDVKIDRFEHFRPLENTMTLAIGTVEGFSPKVYSCGVRATIGMGFTEYANGKKVKKGDPDISFEKGKKLLLQWLEHGAYPCIDNCVKVELTDEQKIGLSMFLYNIGPTQFTGIDTSGTRIAPEAKLLTALNQGKSVETCVRYFSGYRGINNKRSEGLLKRRWWEAAVFSGKVKVEDMLRLDPGKVYGNLDLKNIYKTMEPERDNFYTPKLDEKTVAKVLRDCRGDKAKCMAAILDKDTALALGDTVVYKNQKPNRDLTYHAAADFKKSKGR